MHTTREKEERNTGIRKDFTFPHRTMMIVVVVVVVVIVVVVVVIIIIIIIIIIVMFHKAEMLYINKYVFPFNTTFCLFLHLPPVGVALGYGLDYRGSRVRFPTGAGNFSLHHRIQNGSGAHPVSYPMGTRGSFPGCKAAGA
jgi:hypothetical protein